MSSLADITAVKAATADSTIGGVIIGKALYTGRFTLEEALEEAK